MDISKIGEVSRLVQDIAHISPADNSPVVGERLFWVESGVVVDALERLNSAGIHAAMTPYMPQLVGRAGPLIKYGAFSGKASIKYYLRLKGMEATEEQLEDILDMVNAEGQIRKTVLEESVLDKIITSVMGKV